MATKIHLDDAQRQIVVDNLGLVRMCVNRLLSRVIACGMGDEDAFQIGCVALCRAAFAWDPSRGAFSTYAAVSIHREIVRYCSHGAEQTRGARSVFAKALSGMIILPLDAPINPDVEDDDRTYADQLSEYVPYDDGVIAGEILAALSILDPQDRYVIERCIAGLSYKQIGDEMGVTRERVRVRAGRAQRRLAGKLRLDPSIIKTRNGGAPIVKSPVKAPAKAAVQKSRVVSAQRETAANNRDDGS